MNFCFLEVHTEGLHKCVYNKPPNDEIYNKLPRSRLQYPTKCTAAVGLYFMFHSAMTLLACLSIDPKASSKIIKISTYLSTQKVASF